jgi:hypothetical protein
VKSLHIIKKRYLFYGPTLEQLSNPELMVWLGIESKGKTEPTEIPGARELLKQMTMDQWLTALEQEVSGE